MKLENFNSSKCKDNFKKPVPISPLMHGKVKIKLIYKQKTSSQATNPARTCGNKDLTSCVVTMTLAHIC